MAQQARPPGRVLCRRGQPCPQHRQTRPHRSRHERLRPLLVQEEVPAPLRRERAHGRLVGDQVIDGRAEPQRRVDVHRLRARPRVRQQPRRVERDAVVLGRAHVHQAARLERAPLLDRCQPARRVVGAEHRGRLGGPGVGASALEERQHQHVPAALRLALEPRRAGQQRVVAVRCDEQTVVAGEHLGGEAFHGGHRRRTMRVTAGRQRDASHA